MAAHWALQKLFAAAAAIVTFWVLYELTFRDKATAGFLIAVPYLFDLGHILLAGIYQLRSERRRTFLFEKAIFAFLVISTLYLIGNAKFTAAVTFIWSFTHFLVDERYMLGANRRPMGLEWIEIFHPAVCYALTMYQFVFGPLNWAEGSGLFLAAIAGGYWIPKIWNGARSLKNNYLLIFGALANTALYLPRGTTTSVFFTVSPYLFHYFSWYVFYYHRTPKRREYLVLTLTVNSTVVAFLYFFIEFGYREEFRRIVFQPFILQSLLLFHVITSLRIDNRKARH